MGAKENAVTRACAIALAACGVFAWRNNTGAIKTEKRFFRYGTPGAGDLAGIMPGGIYIEVEVKTKTGKQTDSQRVRQRDLEEAGACYILARGYDDVVDGVKAFQEKRRA